MRPGGGASGTCASSALGSAASVRRATSAGGSGRDDRAGRAAIASDNSLFGRVRKLGRLVLPRDRALDVRMVEDPAP
ncbi:MAG: hypothetical protein IT373_24765 [Polyangiaceae bacterium]|nr:hypothetical protein [Polyangiaceae bacterium]